MDAKTAKALLEPLDHSEFIERLLTDKNGHCCSLGHLARLTSENPGDYSIGNCCGYDYRLDDFVNITHEFIMNKYRISGSITTVNNLSSVGVYNEPLIKDRVIHLLDDMIAAGY